MTKTSLFAAALAMASTVSAHMILFNPDPFKNPDKAPLLASGSNFPCQVGSGGSYIVNTMNQWTVGSDVILQIAQNSATHGGGSCQISVTKDKEPTPQSVWKVIHSIEGGCPTSEQANDGKINSFPFTVPSELPEGQMTMAWTWFNRLGDREMYMNCAPIEVSGGSGDGFDSLPDMAVANIAVPGSCPNQPGVDYTFANPGKYVTKMRTGNSVQDLCGGAPSEGGSTGGYGSSGGSGNPGGLNSGSTSGSTPDSDSGSGSGSGNSGNSGAAVPPAPPIETPEQPNATTPKDSEDSTPKPPSTGGSSSGGASGDVASSGGSPCSENGAITCKDQDHFGICSNGLLVWQSVAAGTACNNGVIARRGYLHRHQRHSI
jgi:hypothetical protein